MSEYVNTIAHAQRTIKGISITSADEDRFWSHVNKNGPLPNQCQDHYKGLDCCWVWNGYLSPSGYGQFKIQGKMVSPHRLSFILNGGFFTADANCVMHLCDLRNCVNPKHLRRGSPKDNNDDCTLKGRGRRASGDNHYTRLHPEMCRRGEMHGNAKLKESQVQAIFIAREKGFKYRQISELYRVSRSCISLILLGKKWSHLKLANNGVETK